MLCYKKTEVSGTIVINMDNKIRSITSKSLIFLVGVTIVIMGFIVATPPKVKAAAPRCIYGAEEVNCRTYMRRYGLTDSNFTGGNGPQENKCYEFYGSSAGAGFVEVSCSNFLRNLSSVCLNGQTYQYVMCAELDPTIFPDNGPVRGKCYLINDRAIEKTCEELRNLNEQNANTREDPTIYYGDCAEESLEKDCGIISVVLVSIRIFTAVFGVVVVIMIAIGGVQYATSRDNPQAVAAAKGRIFKAITALVLYLLIYAILEYLVPGGVL